MALNFPKNNALILFDWELRSRYSETDKMGYVYYAHYLQYFEVARTEMIRALGFPYAKMEDEGIMLPVIRTEIEYKSPLRYDESFLVQVQIFKEPQVKLETWYRIVTENEIKAIGVVDLCFTKSNNRKPIRAPKVFIEAIQQGIIK